MLTGFDPQQIQDLEGARQAIVLLLNLVEEVKQENDWLRITNQQLRDEISRLKGEQGKPDIKPNKKKSNNYSSEKERREPKQWQKSSKLEKVKIDREEIARVDKSELPADAEFKGYEPVVVQELRVETDNIRFLKEKYYSPSLQKTWLAPLPAGYEGEFGQHVRSMIITLDGVAAWDTFITLAETAKKLGVSFYAYVHDRISGGNKLPDLAELIRQRTPAFHPVRVLAPP